MAKITIKVDWLTLTGKDTWTRLGAAAGSYYPAQQLAKDILDDVTEGNAVVRKDRPAPYYAWGFLDIDSGLHVSVAKDVARQGWLLRATGKTLTTPARQDRLLWLAAKRGWNCTRLDFAVDIQDDMWNVADYYTAWKIAHAHNRQKTCAYIEGATGDTFYIGSRASTKFVRVYDKAGEQGLEGRWTRVEMECKGEFASRLAELAQYGIKNCIPFMEEFVDCTGGSPFDVIWIMAYDEANLGYYPPRIRPPKERWFYSDVLAAIRKWSVEDREAVAEWLRVASDEAALAYEKARRMGFETPLL